MTDYTALTAAWNAGTVPAGATGSPFTGGMSTAQKFAAMSAWTIPGPNVDIPITTLIGYLLHTNKIPLLQSYILDGSPESAEAQNVAKTLLFWVGLGTNAPPLTTSISEDYTILDNMLTTLASDNGSGFTSSDVAAILSFAATTLPWVTAPTASGGLGLSTFTMQDVVNAGLS